MRLRKRRMMAMTGELNQIMLATNQRMQIVLGLGIIKRTRNRPSRVDQEGMDPQTNKNRRKDNKKTNHNKIYQVAGLILVKLKRNRLGEGKITKLKKYQQMIRPTKIIQVGCLETMKQKLSIQAIILEVEEAVTITLRIIVILIQGGVIVEEIGVLMTKRTVIGNMRITIILTITSIIIIMDNMGILRRKTMEETIKEGITTQEEEGEEAIGEIGIIGTTGTIRIITMEIMMGKETTGIIEKEAMPTNRGILETTTLTEEKELKISTTPQKAISV